MRGKLRKFWKLLRRTVLKPFIKMFLMRLIIFYQKHFSRHTCLYEPTCSEYMLRAINNHGVVAGVLMGSWRILRCNPLSSGGYDPVPENYFKLKWVL